MTLSRRQVIVGATIGLVAAPVGPGVWTHYLAQAARRGTAVRRAPFPELEPPDENGLRLPPGYSSRLIARSGDRIAGTDHVMPDDPDGAATFPRPGGGWIHVANSEVGDAGGGVVAIVFDPDGTVTDAYSILDGTTRNCAGGATPWNTWLSCEEFTDGRVFECEPTRPGQGVERPGLGTFRHEAAVVDPVTGDVYLTEDRANGRLYRFVPTHPGDLAAGALFAADVSTAPAEMVEGDEATITWRPTSPDEPDRDEATSSFDGGEGAWIDDGRLLFTTKGDRRVWDLELASSRLRVLHDCLAHPDLPLNAVDNIVVHPRTGDVYVGEDGGNMELCRLRESDTGIDVDTLIRIVGQDDSEVTGPAFSPDGRRLYVASQRGVDGRGLLVEITGPFFGHVTRPAAGDLGRAVRQHNAVRIDPAGSP